MNEPRARSGRLLLALSQERLRLLRRQYRGAWAPAPNASLRSLGAAGP
ncbi:hypothetical protein VSR17_14480 [Cupriavidus taiwanensis]|nr:hypothetical protein [Cupriavidus taiwanensis]SOY51356.1 hypothetical protein CBM2588_A20057 [Cupriavidus taiwanensis]SOY54046.1 hypothetical protein CBM2592_A40050 [Cupriavidus taiwanensis]SOY84103.1 hypothetical protein CBM2591_A30057 [Cupriavidus taiwanensis]SOZ58696.1 hypothetical protein CBM2617_A30058 [Cupriavidus taiwanensis]SOZ81238.1 hypothetical protein CBM2618_A40050 [Cupriavidus taiwanensis]